MLPDLDGGWRFGPYELGSPMGPLKRGAKPISLTEVEIKLLSLIVQAAGETVDKEALMRSAWGKGGIEEANLSTYLHRLRAKLGAGIIGTVHGTGYKLVCKSEALGSVPELQAYHLIGLLNQADRERQVMPDTEWDKLYLPRVNEVRAALDWALAEPDRRHLAVALAAPAARLWEKLSVTEGRSYLDRAGELVNDDVRRLHAARLYHYTGLLWRESDRPRALGLFEQAAAVYRKAGDIPQLGAVLGLIGGSYLYLGKEDEAKAALQEAEQHLSKSGQKKALLNVYNDAGLLAVMRGELIEARRCFGLAVDLARSLKDTLRENIVVLNLAELELKQGAFDRAIERARVAAQGLKDAPIAYRVRPYTNLATYEALRGGLVEARRYAEAALAMAVMDGGYWLRLTLHVFAYLAARDGRWVEAARLEGFVEAQFDRFGESRQLAERLLSDQITALLSANLSADSLNVWRAEGAEWTENQAADYVSLHLVTDLFHNDDKSSIAAEVAAQ